MTLIGEEDDWAVIALRRFGQGLDVIDQGRVGDREGILIALLSERAHLDEGHVRVGPLGAIAIEEAPAQAGTEDQHGLAHLLGAGLARRAQLGVHAHRNERIGHILGARMRLAISTRGACRIENGARDQVAVGAAHPVDL